MRKRLIHSLGAFALVLGGPFAIGQEKPTVPPQNPVVDLARRFKVNVQARDFARDFQGVFSPNGEWLAFAADGVFVGDTKTSQPMMKGDLALAVDEMDKAVRVIPDADFPDGLAALGTAERAAMKARRLLPARKESVEEPSKVDEELSVSRWIKITSARGGTVRIWTMVGGGNMAFQPDWHEPEARTPMQEAQDSVQGAITSLRHSRDAGQAMEALDEMDKSVVTLRALLWKKKAPENK
jgi:hypothetical protein